MSALYSPLKTLLAERTTAADNMIVPSRYLLLSQPAGPPLIHLFRSSDTVAAG